MNLSNRGFSLIELITVMILIGIISIVLFSRVGSVGSASIQSGRDDVIAALFFAQQQAMMRSSATDRIRLQINPGGILVTETIGVAAPVTLRSVTMPTGVVLTTDHSLNPITYDKLGRTTAGTITLSGSGNSAGVSARIRLEASGYAFAN